MAMTQNISESTGTRATNGDSWFVIRSKKFVIRIHKKLIIKHVFP